MNWNGKKYLEECLTSVLKTDYSDLEIIVVDNASIDGSQEMIKTRYPTITLIENSSNLGFSKANNIGIKSAAGTLIVLLNNDTRVDEDWVKELIEVGKAPEIGIMGCKIYRAEGGMIQSAGYKLLPSGYHIARGYLQRDNGQFDKIEEVDYVEGSALAIKKSVIESIGLLDPDYFMYYEDVDWCVRARNAGYKVVYVPKSVVYHQGSVGTRKSPFKRIFLAERNRLRFVLKSFSGFELVKWFLYHEWHYMFEKVKELWFQKSNLQVSGQNISLMSEKEGTTQILFYYIKARILSYLWNLIFLSSTLKARC